MYKLGLHFHAECSLFRAPNQSCQKALKAVSKNYQYDERFRATVSVLIGPCCPALLNRIHANVYTVVLLGK